MQPERLASGSGTKRWRTSLIVLLSAGVAPVLANAIYLGIEWIGEGGGYLEDLPGLVLTTLVAAVPFLVLGICVVRAKQKLGLIPVTIASLIVVATGAYGYWVLFPGEESTSTDALIFIFIIPLQWATAAIAGAMASTRGDRRPVTKVAG